MSREPAAVGLRAYLGAVRGRIEQAISAHPFPADQRALLEAGLRAPLASATQEPFGHPLATVYLIAKAHGRTPTAQAEHVGAYLLLHILALDLLDDVQDDDLVDGCYAQAGPAIAVNNAVTLDYLAMDQLRQALALESDPNQHAAFLELHCRIGMQASAGQHRDLCGSAAARTPEQVLAMQQAKTSSMILLCESAALLADCEDAQRDRYRSFGEQLARFVQVRDDLCDIFGKDLSPDLVSDRMSYPLACFLQHADPAEHTEYQRLRAGLPATMPELRSLFYRCGSVQAAAAQMEHSRTQMHTLLMHEVANPAPLRLLLDLVDTLAASVYEPPAIAVSRDLWTPQSGWHARVEQELQRFLHNTAPHDPPAAPRLRPWHQPHWMYVPTEQTVYYPDIEGLAEEVLPFHASLLDVDLPAAAALLQQQLPTVLAHEMFHCWRHSIDCLSDDHWHEEWVANRLAVAYAARFEPTTLTLALRLADDALSRHPEMLDERVTSVLRNAPRQQPNGHGYAMKPRAIAITTFAMLLQLASDEPQWEDSVEALLSPSVNGVTRSRRWDHPPETTPSLQSHPSA